MKKIFLASLCVGLFLGGVSLVFALPKAPSGQKLMEKWCNQAVFDRFPSKKFALGNSYDVVGVERLKIGELAERWTCHLRGKKNPNDVVLDGPAFTGPVKSGNYSYTSDSWWTVKTADARDARHHAYRSIEKTFVDGELVNTKKSDNWFNGKGEFCNLLSNVPELVKQKVECTKTST